MLCFYVGWEFVLRIGIDVTQGDQGSMPDRGAEIRLDCRLDDRDSEHLEDQEQQEKKGVSDRRRALVPTLSGHILRGEL